MAESVSPIVPTRMLSDHLAIIPDVVFCADSHAVRLRRDVEDQFSGVAFVKVGYVFGMSRVRGYAVGSVFGEVVAETIDAGAGEDAEYVSLLFVEF
jgi:hypothetical protein